MKFKENFNEAFGKIKVWKKPIFNLTSIEQNSKEFIEKIKILLNIELTKPIIKPPTPGTILGHTKETLRFNYGVFSEKPSDWFDHIEFGFGENGYFYDVIIKKDEEFDFNSFQSAILELSEFMKKFEDMIESSLNIYYFQTNNIKEKSYDISNCNIMLDVEKSSLKIFNSSFNEVIEKIKLNSESIVQNSTNIVLPEIGFNIVAEQMLKDPVSFNLNMKYLIQGRKFLIKSVPTNSDCWEVSIRGIPIVSVVEIMKSIF